MRGEYLSEISDTDLDTELPPRARRIHHSHNGHGNPNGTTSACAENTFEQLDHLRHLWNYLRVRGEYGTGKTTSMQIVELPPRARRILGVVECGIMGMGTTSACAENTT